MRHILLTAIALTMSTVALANDSTAGHGAGGLVLQRTDAIDMISEDLYVSVEQIRVHYVFRNRAPRDIETVVAFPMPDRDLSQERENDVAYPSEFRTRVGGRSVATALERHVIVNGHDYAALLKQLGIPLAPESIDAAIEAIDRLPAAQKERLRSLGLADYADVFEATRHLVPLWTVKDTYGWKQRFPAGRDLVVDHQYTPGAGSSQIGYEGDFRYSRGALRAVPYCEERDFIAGIERYFRAGGEGSELPIFDVSYVLTTGANWARPIGSFRLVVDKGEPGNLVSFCETGVKKISPTRFEVRHTNWRPTRDLSVLIVGPAD